MDITVREVMTFGVETISPAATLELAAKKMKEHNVGILPVVEDKELLGVVTDRDIVLRAVSERLRPEMTRVGAYEIPSWAIAILFWRKVDQVESRGIPGIRASQNDHDGVVENGAGRAGG